MNEILQSELSQYLGELLHQSENTFDWIEKDSITKKINAVYTLLDIDIHKKTWFEQVAEHLNPLIKK